MEEVEARVTDLCDQLEAAEEHTSSTEELTTRCISVLKAEHATTIEALAAVEAQLADSRSAFEALSGELTAAEAKSAGLEVALVEVNGAANPIPCFLHSTL